MKPVFHIIVVCLELMALIVINRSAISIGMRFHPGVHWRMCLTPGKISARFQIMRCERSIQDYGGGEKSEESVDR